MNQTEQDAGRGMARWLGYLGLIPFVAGGVLAVTGDAAVRDLAVRSVIAYGAVIVSFVGAIHWGLALAHGGARAPNLYLVSVLPSLAAWLALLLRPRAGLILLIATFALVWLYERTALWTSLFPGWFATLRTHLTAAAIGVLAVLLAVAPAA